MDAEMVLVTARSGSAPANWHVWPLRQDRVLRAVIGWGLVAVVGLLLLVLAIAATVPDNFQHGGFSAVATTVLLAVLAMVAFGGAGLCLYDLWRLRHAGDYLLVMTSEDYVKAEPRKVTHVPMESIAYVTLRGVNAQPVYARSDEGSVPGRVTARNYPMGSMFRYRRQPAQPPSLAFVDLRTDREVVVATDNSFDELGALEHILSGYAKGEQRVRTG